MDVDEVAVEEPLHPVRPRRLREHEAERDAEAAQARAFEERQERVCAELGLARDEWFTLARRLWAKWEAE